MKYLYYKTDKRFGEGLLDRRSCLMILLAEAKLTNRTAVVPKFILGSQHNHGERIESYLIGKYLKIDKLKVAYILDEDFQTILASIKTSNILNIEDQLFDFNTEETIVIRNLKNDNFWNLKGIYEVFRLAKLYHGVGVKFIIPLVEASEIAKEIGDKILMGLERPIVGLHLRRGDRLNKKLRASMQQSIIIEKMDAFNYNSVFYCTNDSSYKIDNPKFYSHSDFGKLLYPIKDNYLLFAIEMYVVDNCDISVRTFNDSSPFFNKLEAANTNYAICNYSMHGSNNRFKNIPSKFIKCIYESPSENNRKSFVKRRPIFPLLVKVIRRKLKLP